MTPNGKRRFTLDQITKAKNLWKAGMKMTDIAKALEISERSVKSIIDRHRDQFPHRLHHRGMKSNPVQNPEKIIDAIVKRALSKNRVIRTTIAGAKITMPRVSFIDGPTSRE